MCGWEIGGYCKGYLVTHIRIISWKCLYPFTMSPENGLKVFTKLSNAWVFVNILFYLMQVVVCCPFHSVWSCSITLPGYFRQLSQHCYHKYNYSSIYCNSIHRVTSYIWLWFPVTGASICGPGKGCRCRAVTSNLLCSRWWWLPFTPDSPAITALFDIHQLCWATTDFTFYISNISLHAAGKSCVIYFKVSGKSMMG